MKDTFLKQLQKEARMQKKLYETRILPKQFDPVTSFIGENSLVTLVLLSLLSAIILEILKII